MRIPRFHAAPLPTESGERYTLRGEGAKHIRRVLRMTPGQEVELFDGKGSAALFAIDEVSGKAVELRCLRRLAGSRELPFALVCAVAPPKGKRRQRLVESLTELGAQRVHPLELARCQNKSFSPEKLARWSLEAAKQCGRNQLLQWGEPLKLNELLSLARSFPLALVPDPREDRSLRDVIPAEAPESLLLVVGPEGGFTQQEQSAFKEAGLVGFRLGKSILRIETAACAVTAALIAAWC